MTTRKWKLVVSDVGATTPASEAVVEAANWMAGFKLARGRIGEPESIPQGASCTVAPDGRVTVFDAARRRTYVLSPEFGPEDGPHSYPPGTFTASRVPDPPSGSAAPPNLFAGGGPSSASRTRPKTMAFVMDGPLPGAGISIPVGQPASTPSASRPSPADATPAPVSHATPPRDATAEARAAMRRTMSFVPGQFDLPPVPTHEIAVGTRREGLQTKLTSPASPSGRPGDSGLAPAPVRVLFEQSIPPTEESPIHYHVAGLFAPRMRNGLELERTLHRELERMRAKLADEGLGQFIQVLVYGTVVSQPEPGRELAQLTYKGWRNEVNLRFPVLEDEIASVTLPGTDDYGAAAEDVRLFDALDAFEDVWFLATPREGFEFAARLLEQLLPDVHVVCAGLDTTTDAFVPCVERGSIPRFTVARRIERRGLVHLAEVTGHPVRLASPTDDARVEVPAEGSETGPVVAMVIRHGADALGYVRVARAKRLPPFDEAEEQIVRAIGERLALFLRLRGAIILE